MSTTQSIFSETRDLLLFQLGPVQDFIAQARSTRDLWSGSYMLSWLMAHAIKTVLDVGNACGGVRNEDFIMPSIQRSDNPLVFLLRDSGADLKEEEVKKALIPNLPNKFTVLVPEGKGVEIAQAADVAVRKELKNMGESVWQWLCTKAGANTEWKAQWDAQLAAFLQVTWAVYKWEPHGKDWHEANLGANRMLAARRNTREFSQWPTALGAFPQLAPKDSLSGKEEAVGNEEFWKALKENYKSLFKAGAHTYGAVNLIKRLWVFTRDDSENFRREREYISKKLGVWGREVLEHLRVPDIPSIAKRNNVEGTNDREGESGNPYVAVLMFDGDKMGDKLGRFGGDPENIRHISQTLSTFALGKVNGIVANHKGHLVYAGGDDVLAILPSTEAINCAKEIREAFQESGREYGFDGSCGIAVGHKDAPLQMLVKEARRMESVAKGRYGRSALAIALYKRSGEIIEWGCKWDSDALTLMNSVTALSRQKKLSGRFSYALAALLRPYDLEKLKGKGELVQMEEIILEEFRHVSKRQGAGMNQGECDTLREKARGYLEEIEEGYEAGEGKPRQRYPEDFLNLFLVETFIHRLRGEE